MSAAAYPLAWPQGRARVAIRERARFVTSFAQARDACLRELKLLEASEIVISTNIPLKPDGMPYAAKRNSSIGNVDTGVAVYFTYKHEVRCFACDRWLFVEANMQAIAKTIEAFRGIGRWGTGEMVESAFTGSTLALPAPPAEGVARTWREILGVGNDATFENVVMAYHTLRGIHHPDKPHGDADRFDEVQKAYEQACRDLGI